MRLRALLWTLLLVAAFTVAYLVAWAVGPLFGQVPHCGVERWAVKTMTDPARRSVDLIPIPTAIDSLRSLPAPDVRHIPDRVPTEMHTFTVHAVLLGWKVESDRDIHIVLADSSDTTHTMIGEIPNVACAATDIAPVHAGMLAARQAALTRLGKPAAKFKHFAPPVRAVVTGVGFFDFIHGQTGVAGNGIELHPITALTFP